MKSILKLKNTFNNLLARPSRVLLLCVLVVAANLIFRGGFFELLSLRQNLNKIKVKKENLSKDIKDLDMKIVRASDPEFLELEVLNRFDLAQEGDLIFVFSDDKVKRKN